MSFPPPGGVRFTCSSFRFYQDRTRPGGRTRQVLPTNLSPCGCFLIVGVQIVIRVGRGWRRRRRVVQELRRRRRVGGRGGAEERVVNPGTGRRAEQRSEEARG